MARMRDKLIHEYSGVDLEIVWQTISNDLPKVKKPFKKWSKMLNNRFLEF